MGEVRQTVKGGRRGHIPRQVEGDIQSGGTVEGRGNGSREA